MKSPATTVASVILLVCGLTVPFLARELDKARPHAELGDVLYINSAKTVRYISLGYTGLAACIYWTRAVQYFGGKHVDRDMRYDLLQPLLNLTTELDPKLTVAYEFGSIFLSQDPPQGAGRPDQAVQLVERGIQRNPERWKLYYFLGFIHYFERQDYPAAAEAFERGSRVKNAHPFLKVMAAAARQKGGEIEMARLLWTSIYESTEDKTIKDTAAGRLISLRVDEDIIHIKQIIERYRQQTGSYPSTWQQLIGAGYLPGVPVDPSGAPYQLKPGGVVEVAEPEKWPFIEHGKPAGHAPTGLPNPMPAASPVKSAS
ncbi:MAG TPA: hypothetical protein VM056_00525 [Terriglobales bacterium]|nr:hypothetical protein [Terriglobales bacterium]